MRKFKIFYSWQSDLPKKQTRNFIRECIDEAIDLAEESETIEAERDEATKDTTGSPNIVTTLFSKIDECDLFIADISLCFSSDTTESKKSPNPNVLLELGYAVKTLGWDKVICLCNTDFGKEYPFDIAHNRITCYSLEGKNEKEIQNYVRKIIFANIRDLRNAKPRAKAGEATHILGTYDYKEQNVKDYLAPINIKQREGYQLHNHELLEKAKKLFSQIQEINTKIDPQSVLEKPSSPDIPKHQTLTIRSNGIDVLSKAFQNIEKPVIWTDAEADARLIKLWLDFDVDDNFFFLGTLKYVTKGFDPLGSAPILVGEEFEKAKYEKLGTLSRILTRLDVRTKYLNTFEGMIFVPVAIKNISSLQDENISVVLNVENGEIVEPNENLVYHEYEGIQGMFCRDDDNKNDVGIICELFGLEEDGIIHCEDIPYNFERHRPPTPIMTSRGFRYPEKNEKDYALELQEFIASSTGFKYYEFEVNNLRPGEVKWLCCGLLIKPTSKNVKIVYHINSKHSTGDLSGEFEILAI